MTLEEHAPSHPAEADRGSVDRPLPRKAAAGDSGFAHRVRRAAFREYVELVGGWDEGEQRQLHERRFAEQELHGPHCPGGFPWYRMPKLDHQMMNIRHLQHHTALLSGRLRQVGGIDGGWIGGR